MLSARHGTAASESPFRVCDRCNLQYWELGVSGRSRRLVVSIPNSPGWKFQGNWQASMHLAQPITNSQPKLCRTMYTMCQHLGKQCTHTSNLQATDERRISIHHSVSLWPETDRGIPESRDFSLSQDRSPEEHFSRSRGAGILGSSQRTSTPVALSHLDR